nr:hypothetical protein [Peristeroidobacter soli]
MQYATGFRDGYSNGRAAGLHLTDRGPDLFNVPEDVDVEKIKNYELGFKGVFFDRRRRGVLYGLHRPAGVRRLGAGYCR